MAFEKIYSAELERLNDLGREFAKENPTIAPYISSRGGDPDVERLMQGFAFLSAMVRQKLDDELPEFIGDVLSAVGPDLAKPMPSMTVLKLGVTGKSQNGYLVNADTPFASLPLDGTSCQFSTSWPLTVQPVELNSATVSSNGKGSRLRLTFDLIGLPLSQWYGQSLVLYLSGPYPEATTLLIAMRQNLQALRIFTPENPDSQSPLKLVFDGLDSDNCLYETGKTVAQHLRWIREFLAFPERAFFLKLEGLDQWSNRVGDRKFCIEFDFSMPAPLLPNLSIEHIAVNAVPAVNLFQSFANPIALTHLKESYQLTAMDSTPGHVVIHDVISVTGRLQGESQERIYQSTTELMADEGPYKYQVVASEGALRSEHVHKLRLPFGSAIDLSNRETLSVLMRCSNGRLPERLRPGSVCLRVADSPERITVTNVTNPTGFSTPALGKDAMWKIIGHARLNLHAILDKDNLKELLQVYLPEGAGDPARVSAARRRLLGIEDVLVIQDTRMVRGTRIQGQIIKLQLQQDFFAGNGDLMLFGEMLLPFLAGLIGLNSYVTLVVTNPNSGAQFEWPTLIAPGLML